MTYVVELPPGYDERTTIGLEWPANRIVITHPELPVLVLDEKTNTFAPLLPKEGAK